MTQGTARILSDPQGLPEAIGGGATSPRRRPWRTALAALSARLGREARNESVRGAVVSLGMKVSMSAANLVMLTLIARSMDAREFGIFAFWYNCLVFLAVVAGLGQEKLILSNWSEYQARPDWALARGALRFGAVTTVAGSLVVAAAVLLASLSHGTDPHLAVAASAFLIVQTLFFYSAHATRAMVGIVRAGIHETTWRIVVIVAVVAALLSEWQVGTAEFFTVAAIGMGIGFVAQTADILRLRPDEIRRVAARMLPRRWAVRSVKMASGAGLEAASQYLEVIAIGLVLEPAAAGAYFVAARLANIFLMISSGLDSFTTRQVPRLFHAGGPGAVAPILGKLAILTSVPVGLGFLGIVLFGHPILGLFGAGFTPAYPVLVALAAGTAILAMTGPAMPVLVLTGHEGIYSAILGAMLVLRLVSVVALAHLAGPFGAALGSAAVTAAGAVALTLACRIRAGLDPSLGSLLAPRPAPATEPRP